LWVKLSNSPRDKGLYRAANDTVRVKYVVNENGRLVQRATSFPKNGSYRRRLTIDATAAGHAMHRPSPTSGRARLRFDDLDVAEE
jgi:hypothetical protein